MHAGNTNLLVVLPGRLLYYTNGHVLESPLEYNFPNNQFRRRQFEELESDIGRNGRWDPKHLQLIETSQFQAAAFWQHIYQNSCRQGILQVHQYGGSQVPLELFRTSNTEWISSFTIQFMHPVSDARENSPTNIQSALVWANPMPAQSGDTDSLSYASQEAGDIAAAFKNSDIGVHFLRRSLDEFELHELRQEYDCLFYLGHARFQKGHPLIPLRQGWTPLLYTGLAESLRLLVLGACLDTSGEAWTAPGQCFVYPLYRIADRPNSFLTELANKIGQGLGIGMAYHQACLNDKVNGDIRRFIFRLQGF